MDIHIRNRSLKPLRAVQDFCMQRVAVETFPLLVEHRNKISGVLDDLLEELMLP